METKSIANSILILRICTLLALVACLITFVLNKITVTVDAFNWTRAVNSNFKITSKDVATYRFEFYVAVIGAVYTLLQLPFAVYLAIRGTRIVNSQWLLEFDYYGDKVISYLLATATGAGLAFDSEFKSLIDTLFARLEGKEDVKGARSSYNSFLDRGTIATIFMLLGFVFMVLLSGISSSKRVRQKDFFG